jgi:hypothetical protein
MLNVTNRYIMLSVVMLNVFMLSVVAPKKMFLSSAAFCSSGQYFKT